MEPDESILNCFLCQSSNFGRRKSMRKYTNAKVSTEFNDLLSAHELFHGDNYKLIAPCHYLLNYIYRDCLIKKREYMFLHSKWIQDRFHSHVSAYRPVIDALIELELLKIKPNQNGVESYLHSEDESKSFTKAYKVTPKCAEMLTADNKEWLRKLHHDPQTRKVAKRCKAQKHRRLKPTGDLIVDSTRDNLFSLRYDRNAANAVLTATTDENRANNIIYSLINIETGDFEFERHKSTGRIYNAWNMMNSQLRPSFYIRHHNKNLFNSHIIDLRAAHPLFWAIYVKNSYYSNNLFNNTSNSNPSPNHSSILHYVTAGEAFLAEVDRWNALWCNPTVDPRDVIAADLNTSKENVKALLNTAINDGRNANRLHLWIKANFPRLHTAWQGLGIGQTGVNISRLYESRLIRDNEFQAFINSMDGVKVMDEHDGLSVFSSPDDTEIESKIESIRAYIAQSCFDKFGIKPVIKSSRVAGLSNGSQN